MIELDANGQISLLQHCRVYIVAGYTDGRPFKGFNIWTDTGPMTQRDIEAYNTFQGWATDTLDATQLVSSATPPTKANEFRVALMEPSFPGGSPYPQIHTGDARYDSPGKSNGFLGWLTPTLSVHLPDPIPRLFVRYRCDTPHGRIESLFITTRAALTAGFGRRVNFGRPFGMSEDLIVTLEPRHFLQLSDEQSLVEELAQSADDGTLCGWNPLLNLA